MHDYRYNDVWIMSMIEIFKQQSNDSLKILHLIYIDKINNNNNFDIQQNLLKIELMIWLFIKCNRRT